MQKVKIEDIKHNSDENDMLNITDNAKRVKMCCFKFKKNRHNTKIRIEESFDWSKLCKDITISEKFFDKHIDKVDWRMLSGNTNISEKFFAKHLDKVDWRILSSNTNISEKFFTKHLDKIH